jgi:tetratricopeptide (TPR) repeat protein
MRTLLLCLLPLALFAQHPHGADGEKPIALLPGLGAHRHAIAASPEAQKFFDQGLALLYGFNRYEALRSFRRAAELDPKALMPRWGMAMAHGPHINMDLDGDVAIAESCAAVKAGLALRESAPENERAYIDAVAARCPVFQPLKYVAAMRALAERYPDDLDAAALYAEALMIPARWRWYRDGQPADGVREAEQALESVLRRNPDHPGANHFYIHAVESSPTPERAIPSAQRLMGIVPAAGHLVHMPAHIWMILGDYELAASTNERAAEVDRQYMKATGVTGSAYAGYYVHNLHFVAAARQMQGRMDDAIRAAQDLAAAAAPHVESMAAMVDAFMPAPYFAWLRFDRWDDILSAPAPDRRLLATTAIRHYARAIAFRAKGDRASAAGEQAAFEAARRRVPGDWLWLNNKASAVLALASDVLNARLALNDAASIPHWRSAVEREAKLIYDEPPPWYYPVRESLGAALLRAGQTAEAETVFRDGLRRTPRNGRILFGLMETLKARGNTAAADLVRAEFEAAWRRSGFRLQVSSL